MIRAGFSSVIFFHFEILGQTIVKAKGARANFFVTKAARGTGRAKFRQI